MADPAIRPRLRSVPGQFNHMAVCSVCDRDATQTRFTYYCVDCLNGGDLFCDECRPVEKQNG